MEVSSKTALFGCAVVVLALGGLVAVVRLAPPRPPPRGDMAPLEAPAVTTTLPLTGFGTAVVALPVGATRAAPVIVAVLGIGDNPEDQCMAWRDIIGPRAFILCPRGSPHMVEEAPDEAGVPEPATVAVGTTGASPDDLDGEGDAEAPPAVVQVPPRKVEPARTHQEGFYPVDLATLEREVTVGLQALRARYGAYVAGTGAVYAGFSRGAFLGAQLAARSPRHFKRLVLIEGGQTPWQRESAAAFARGGGERVLFVCGQPQCVDESGPAAATLRAERIDTRVIHGEGEGHGYKNQVKAELRRSFSWVIDGEQTWAD